MQNSTPSRLASFSCMSQQNWFSRALSHLCKRPAQPNFEEYNLLKEALQSSDDEMDQVIIWMMKNPRLHRQYFETALFKGIEHLAEPIPELEKFFSLVTQIPAWLEQDKIEQALGFTYKLA